MFDENNVNTKNISLDAYRQAETTMHTELMNICRKYVHKLSLVSLMGVIDIVKEETRDLERHTKKDFNQSTDQPNTEKQAQSSYF